MERAGIEKAARLGVHVIPHIENFADTHMSRNSNEPNAARKWSDPKFKTAHDRYVELCTKEFGEDRSKWPVEVDAEKWIEAAGSPKKGKIMGLSLHVNAEELGFNTHKQRSLFTRVGSSSQAASMRNELEDVKKVAYEANEKCMKMEAFVESQNAQLVELMKLVRTQTSMNQSNPSGAGSAQVMEGASLGNGNVV